MQKLYCQKYFIWTLICKPLTSSDIWYTSRLSKWKETYKFMHPIYFDIRCKTKQREKQYRKTWIWILMLYDFEFRNWSEENGIWYLIDAHFGVVTIFRQKAIQKSLKSKFAKLEFMNNIGMKRCNSKKYWLVMQILCFSFIGYVIIPICNCLINGIYEYTVCKYY